MFKVPSSGTISGFADDDETGSLASNSVSGTYSIASDGYGSLTFTTGVGSIGALGVYMTDPNLNLTDPNNTAKGLGGALILDLDSALSSGTGILVPQTDPTTASFSGKYAFGVQDFNGNPNFWEFDYLGQGSVSGGALSGTGLVSDPGAFFGANAEDSGVTFAGTPLADGAHAGR